MKLLLDLHVLAWWFSDNPRLTGGARARIAHPATQVMVSAACAWEMAIKHEAGRWPEAIRMLDRWDALLAEAGFAALAVSAAHGKRAARWDWPHRDPFDRLLAAQSMLEGAALVTADPVLLGLLPDAVNAAG